MARTDRAVTAASSTAPGPRSGSPSIAPVFPLLLLETMRDMDRPEEVLEDEDLSISLPRRLGLSDVVGVQIRRFQEEMRQRRLQSAGQITDLLRLVVRRPDAEPIFHEAGRRVARHYWQQRSKAMRGVLRVMPNPIPRIAAHRAARRMFRQLVGDSRLTISRWPVELQIERSLTAEADPRGAACAFYAGAFAELMEIYTNRTYRVKHPECETKGASRCKWVVEVAS